LARLQDARCRDPHLAQLNDRLLGLLSETRPV